MAGYFPLPDPNSFTYTLGAVAPRPTVLKAQPKPGVRSIGGAINPASAVTGEGFDINPQPQTGSGAYGAVPGPIQYPTTPYAEASRIYPGLADLTPQAGEEIRSQIAGEFSPQEEAALWDLANSYGVASGMPGAQLWSNKFFGNRIEEGMKRRQQGVDNYNALLQELSKMGVDPALAAEIAARNANMAAAPNPADAAAELERKYLNAAMNPAGGTTRPSGIAPGSYGGNLMASGALSPPASWYRSPAGGTMPTTSAGRPGTATTSARTEDDIINAYLDEIAPVEWPTYENPATPMYQDEYSWLWDQGTPTQDDSWFDPGYANTDVNSEDWWFDPAYNNQGDPWAIYE